MGKKESSILRPDKTLENIVSEMILWVFKEEVYAYPYITWISKGQLLWGKGSHWKDAPEYLQQGLLRNAGIKKPSQRDLDFQVRMYGYCMEWPEPKTWALTSIMKSDFINKKALGKKYSDLEFLYGRGYINEKTGNLDPDYSYGISGWFVMNSDKAYRMEQIEWIASQPEYIRAQYSRCCRTFPDVVRQQIESGHKKAITNSYLLEQEVYKEIRSALQDRHLLPEETGDYKGKQHAQIIHRPMKRLK
jgi:hypothetical protein